MASFANAAVPKPKVNPTKIIETNLSLHLNRIFKLGANGHVDLRSPNPAASDYLVIDYNGTFYPSDESRMLSRVGLIDLSIGNFDEGIDKKKVEQFNKMQNNEEYEFCRKCAYQSFCGVDVVDDLSRYHSVNYEKSETHFCKMRMSTFDYIFSKISKKDKNSLYPDVILIKEDLNDNALKALYLMCDALVAPSRGEGFGLPIAEFLIQNNKPVVVPDKGGHLDFCGNSNLFIRSEYEPCRVSQNYHYSEIEMKSIQVSLTSAQEKMRQAVEINKTIDFSSKCVDYLNEDRIIKLFKEALEI